MTHSSLGDLCLYFLVGRCACCRMHDHLFRLPIHLFNLEACVRLISRGNLLVLSHYLPSIFDSTRLTAPEQPSHVIATLYLYVCRCDSLEPQVACRITNAMNRPLTLMLCFKFLVKMCELRQKSNVRRGVKALDNGAWLPLVAEQTANGLSAAKPVTSIWND